MNRIFKENIRFNLLDFAFSAISTILLILSLVFFFLDNHSVAVSIFGLIITIVFVIKFNKNIPLFIMFAFFLMYNVDAVRFYLTNVDLTLWPDFQQKNIVNEVIIYNSLFILALGSSIPSNINNGKIFLFDYSLKNIFVFFYFFIVCVLIFLFGISGDSLFDGGAYGSAEKSTLNEYFIMFFLFLILSLPKYNFRYASLLAILALSYSLKNFLYGGRIEVLQLFLLIFYVFYVFNKKIKYKWFYLFVFFAFYVNEVTTAVRSNPVDFFSGSYWEYLNPISFFKGDNDLGYLASNQGDVLQSSARLLGLIENNVLGLWERIFSFLSYIFSPIIPATVLPEYSNLASYKQDLYKSGGGGLIGAYFFVWLGFVGPIFIGLFIGYFIKCFYTKKSIYYKIYGATLLITFPRWYAYNPVFIVKFCFYSVFIFFMVSVIVKFIKAKNDSSNCT
jgi:hypothetical protein